MKTATRTIEGTKADAPPQYRRQARHVILVPSGDCPISLRDMNRHDGNPFFCEIIEWFHKVRRHGLEHHIFYTADAIAYWARTEYDPMRCTYDAISRTILEYADAIGENDTHNPHSEELED